MKELIYELRELAGVQCWASDHLANAADALELQAREIASKQATIDGMNEAHWKVVQELAALKVQPSGVVPTQWSKSFTECWPVEQDDLEGDWAVGAVMRDGDEIYCPVITVEAAQYDAPGESEKIARALVTLLNPEREVALLNQPASAGDREALIYLMERFDNEVWVCPRCSHEEPTKDMDSASYLREYLAGAQPASAGDERADFEVFAKRRGLSTVKYTGGMYVCNNTMWAEIAWVEARAALSANHSEQAREDE